MLWTDFVPGRWLRRRPLVSGVYAMRPVGGVAFVNYFDANPAVATPGQLQCAIEHGGAVRELEFLHLDGDELANLARGYTCLRRGTCWRPRVWANWDRETHPRGGPPTLDHWRGGRDFQGVGIGRTIRRVRAAGLNSL